MRLLYWRKKAAKKSESFRAAVRYSRNMFPCRIRKTALFWRKNSSCTLHRIFSLAMSSRANRWFGLFGVQTLMQKKKTLKMKPIIGLPWRNCSVPESGCVRSRWNFPDWWTLLWLPSCANICIWMKHRFSTQKHRWACHLFHRYGTCCGKIVPCSILAEFRSVPQILTTTARWLLRFRRKTASYRSRLKAFVHSWTCFMKLVKTHTLFLSKWRCIGWQPTAKS